MLSHLFTRSPCEPCDSGSLCWCGPRHPRLHCVKKPLKIKTRYQRDCRWRVAEIRIVPILFRSDHTPTPAMVFTTTSAQQAVISEGRSVHEQMLPPTYYSRHVGCGGSGKDSARGNFLALFASMTLTTVWEEWGIWRLSSRPDGTGFHHVFARGESRASVRRSPVVEVANPFVVLLGSIGFWNAR